MRLVDSHAHLDMPQFQSDLDEVVQRASQQGVSDVLTVGCLSDEHDVESAVMKILDRYPGVLAAFGVHPHDARFYSDDWESRLAGLIEKRRVVALGEIGLDYYYDNSPREVQRDVFARQLRLAKAAGKPVIVHSRDSEEDTSKILKEESAGEGALKGVLHCFTGSMALAEESVKAGFHISFGGILTFPKSEALREVARWVPRDRILVETDAPYLAPVPLRGKRNEPAFVVRVAEELARVRGESLEEIARVTTENFFSLFMG